MHLHLLSKCASISIIDLTSCKNITVHWKLFKIYIYDNFKANPCSAIHELPQCMVKVNHCLRYAHSCLQYVHSIIKLAAGYIWQYAGQPTVEIVILPSTQQPYIVGSQWFFSLNLLPNQKIQKVWQKIQEPLTRDNRRAAEHIERTMMKDKVL